jgi:uncharacterized protein YecE (DUF72 family)
LIRVGTAGWQIPRDRREAFPDAGSTLQRYAAVFPAVEINATFYKPPRPTTLARWAETTPPAFRFAVKAPRTVTHERRLVDTRELIDAFLSNVGVLGGKLGPVLIQLPPSLAFDYAVAGRFLAELRGRFSGDLACEPRHPSWFTHAAEELLADAQVARVAADPACVPEAAAPGGFRGFQYSRLHGSPAMYRTPYGEDRIAALAARLADPAWVFFDNTMSGAAAADALMLQAMLR